MASFLKSVQDRSLTPPEYLAFRWETLGLGWPSITGVMVIVPVFSRSSIEGIPFHSVGSTANLQLSIHFHPI